MARAKLRRLVEGMMILGVLLTTGGGGKCPLLSGSSGGRWWTSGTSVSVWEGLGGSVDAWRGSWLLGGFSGRREAKCLWCQVRFVVRMKANAWVFRKVVFQGVGRWSLGRFQGLWCREFLKR